MGRSDRPEAFDLFELGTKGQAVLNFQSMATG